MMNEIFIGTAGWSIPTQLKNKFNSEGTHLVRYASTFNCVEINSSFYREHKHETYIKWAASVPENFRFSVKLSRHFTQVLRLNEPGPALGEVLRGISGLGEKWGCLLIQLPPSLDFNFQTAEYFLKNLREQCSRPIAWEPRHKSWSTPRALELLAEYKISKVFADPERCALGQNQRVPMAGLRYLRLHGSPEIYKSRYSLEAIHQIRKTLLKPNAPGSEPIQQSWCIFDNTTYGFATENAMELQSQL